MESKRDFFRKLYPNLPPLSVTFSNILKERYGHHLRFCVEHPIVAYGIALVALLLLVYVGEAFVPWRVQIEIDGLNTSAAYEVEKAVHSYFSHYNETVVSFLQAHPLFSDDKEGGRSTNEILLVKKHITGFEKTMKDFTANNQSYIDGPMRCQEEGFAWGAGGLKVPLKKKVYVITVKAPEELQEVVLLGGNSCGSDLKKLIQDKFAEWGTVATNFINDQEMVFTFQLRSGLSRAELKREIHAKFREKVNKISGENPLRVDARKGGEERICLDVANLTSEQKRKVGEALGISIMSETVIEVYGDRQELNDKLHVLEDAGIHGEWRGEDTYVFITKQFCVVLHGEMDMKLEGIFDSLRKIYSLTRAGNSFTWSCGGDKDWDKGLGCEMQKLVDYGLLKLQSVEEEENATTLVYAVIERMEIDVSTLDAADRSTLRDIFGGNEDKGVLLIEKSNLTSDRLQRIQDERHITIDKNGKAIKMPPMALNVIIQGTPAQVTLECLRNSGFSASGNGDYAYISHYYKNEEKESKLDALNALAPALSQVGMTSAGDYVYLQKKRVSFSAPELPEMEKQIQSIMDGRMDGYLSADEIERVLDNFKQYSIVKKYDDNGIAITISKPQISYEVTFFLGISDDYERICLALKKLCGEDLRIGTPRGNPQYFTFHLKSTLDSQSLKDEIYGAAYASCNSVARKNIVVNQEDAM